MMTIKSLIEMLQERNGSTVSINCSSVIVERRFDKAFCSELNSSYLHRRNMRMGIQCEGTDDQHGGNNSP